MMKHLWLILCILISTKQFAQPCKEIVGYYPNWQWYDRSKLVNPMTIDYSKYSIINYCFFAPQTDGSIQSTDSWSDENLLFGQPDWSNGGYIPNTSIVSQAHLNNVKILPSIGGWTLSSNFPSIAASSTKRQMFAQACVNLIQTYDFDGIDLDWEYPGFVDHNGTQQDYFNFTLLLQEVRTAIDNYGQSVNKQMLLTAAVSASYDKMNDVDWANVSPLLDIINVMSYDYFGAFDPIANHNSPLFAPLQGDPQFNLEKSIDLLINQYNVSPNKITAGVAFYGRSMKTNGTPQLFASNTGQADNVTFQADEGTPLYYSTILSLGQFNEHWDNQAKVPYLTGKNGLNTFVSYDNEQSIGLKAEFIVEKDLRGAIIWEITGDYIETFSGSGIISGTPLADTINKVFCNYIPNSTGNDTTLTASIKQQFADSPNVYPNPTTGVVYFDTEVNHISYEIIDVFGRLVVENKNVESNNPISLKHFNNGVYLLRVKDENGNQFNKRIIKN